MPLNYLSKFQSTLPREERLRQIRISCHKLDFNPRSHERSDGEEYAVKMFEEISIHAPTRGATGDGFVLEQGYNISIHAPTRGATTNHYLHVFRQIHFNPRSHERSDGYTQPFFLSLYNISIHAPTRGATSLSAT